jgi:hypothetical protein
MRRFYNPRKSRQNVRLLSPFVVMQLAIILSFWILARGRRDGHVCFDDEEGRRKGSSGGHLVV